MITQKTSARLHNKNVNLKVYFNDDHIKTVNGISKLYGINAYFFIDNNYDIMLVVDGSIGIGDESFRSTNKIATNDFKIVRNFKDIISEKSNVITIRDWEYLNHVNEDIAAILKSKGIQLTIKVIG